MEILKKIDSPIIVDNVVVVTGEVWRELVDFFQSVTGDQFVQSNGNVRPAAPMLPLQEYVDRGLVANSSSH